MLFAALMLALSQVPSAPQNPVLKRAIVLYESVEVERARRALQLLVDAPELSDGDRLLASMYLAAACHALKDEACTDDALRKADAVAPGAKLPADRFDASLRARQDELFAEKNKNADDGRTLRSLPTTSGDEPVVALEDVPQPAARVDSSAPSAALPVRKIAGGVAIGAAAVPLWFGSWSALARQKAVGFRAIATTDDARAVYDGYIQRTTVQSAVGFSAAAVLVGAGAFLLFSGGHEDGAAPEPSVALAPGYAGVTLSGSFDP